MRTIMEAENHTTAESAKSMPRLISVNVSPGGIPRLPVTSAYANRDGLKEDHRAHEKHRRPERAVSLLDYEIIVELVREGFMIWPGRMGENLTVVGVGLQQLPPHTRLLIGEVILQLEQPRKPCYVLDAIDPCLKEAVVGRCGYLASVVKSDTLQPGMLIRVLSGEGQEVSFDLPPNFEKKASCRNGRPTSTDYSRQSAATK